MLIRERRSRMNGVMTDYWQRLKEIERQLKKQVADGDLLLGELESSQVSLQELRGLFKEQFGSYQSGAIPLDTILKRTKSEWPVTFAFYLTLEGANSYKDGDYWSVTTGVLNLKSRQDQERCGKLFLDILNDFHLPTFEREHQGHKYVTPILLHAGIPTNSLDSLFTLLHKENGRHTLSVDAASLLAEWRRAPSDYFIGIRKPVERFLKSGGAVAEDFLSRILELMAIEERSDAESLDLPERVIKRFEGWREQQDQHFLPRSRVRLASPSLCLAPFGEGVWLLLPDQQLPKRITSLLWLIKTNEQGIRRINTDRQPQSNGYVYTVPELVSVGVSATYQVVLEADGETLRTWPLAGMGQPPLLIFEPYNPYHGVALDGDERDQPGRRWLLYPQDHQILTGTSASHRLEILPALQGEWAGFRLEKWEVAPGVLQVVDAQRVERARLNIAQESGWRRPQLVGGKPMEFDVSQLSFPLYTGAPPQLVLPIRDDTRSAMLLNRWRLAIRSDDPSYPAGLRSYRLEEIKSALSWGNGRTIRVDLTDERLLGSTPVGKFEVQVRGPLRSYVLGLRMVPPIRMEGHGRVYFSAEPATLTILCDAKTRVEVDAGEDGVEVREIVTGDSEHHYQIVAAPTVWQVPLGLRHKTGTLVSLHIPLRRARWRLVKRGEEELEEWQNSLLRMAVKEVSAEHALQVYAPIAADGARLYDGWRLVNSLDEVVQENRLEGERIFQQVNIPLTELRMAWRENLDSYRLQLLIAGESVGDRHVIDALHLTPTLELGKVINEWAEIDGHARLSIRWEYPQIARCRRLYLWPQDEPWLDRPRAILTVPDEASAEATWEGEVVSNIPPAVYLAEMVIVSPWEPDYFERPSENQPNTFRIQPDNLDRYYEDLIVRSVDGGVSAEQLLRLLVYQHRQGLVEAAYDTARSVFLRRSELSLQQQMHWTELTRAWSEPTHYKFAQLSLFSPETISQIDLRSFTPAMEDQYIRHRPISLPPQSYALLLERGIGDINQEGLTVLCRSDNDVERRQGIRLLLKEMVKNNLSLVKAVEIIRPKAEAVANLLANGGDQDAINLLLELVVCGCLDLRWVWRGLYLESEVGLIWVRGLRDKQGNQGFDFGVCCPLPGDFYADVSIQGEVLAGKVSARLDLSNRQLRFTSSYPHQCRQCDHLFGTIHEFKYHQQRRHPGQNSRPKGPKSIAVKRLSLWSGYFEGTP